MIYDTGSGYLTVTSNECDHTCKTKAYNISKSLNASAVDNKTFPLTVIQHNVKNLIVWLGKLTGYVDIRHGMH